MDPRLFKKFSDIIYEKAGISLKEGKESLVAARLRKRQQALGIESAEDYLYYLKTGDDGQELIHFLDAISTNFTSFFREREHFELLAKFVKDWINQGQKKIRLWSAASSSGEEPYSMAITALEAINDGNVDLRILATDLSTAVLNKAKTGIYTSEKLRALSKQRRLLYFTPIANSVLSEPLFQINAEVQRHIVFKRLNLSNPPFPMTGPFDAVFCRNVMIYFDQSVRQKLVVEIERLVKPGGVLMTGRTETLMNIRSGFHMFAPSVYCRPPVPARTASKRPPKISLGRIR